MASFIYQILNSQIVVKLGNTEYFHLEIYETKEILDLYLSNQVDLKSINGM